MTITEVTGDVQDSNIVPGCDITSWATGSMGMVIGPNVQGAAREFTYQFYIKAGGQLSDGTQCNSSVSLSDIYLENSNLVPVSIDSVSPSLPYSIPNASTQYFTITFQALEGNYYDGGLTLEVQVSGA